MVPAPLRFFEMKEEELMSDSTKLNETKFGIAPKALDAVDVIFPTGEFVVVMVNAPVLVATQHQAIIPEPAIGIDRGFGKHLSLDDRLQFCPGTVFHHAGKDFAAALEQPDHRRFPGSAASSPASHASGSEVRFIDLHLASERLRFLDRQLQRPCSQQAIQPLSRVAIDAQKFARARCRNISAKHLQQPLEFML